MKHNDKQIGKPQIIYKDSKTNINALTGLEEGAVAYATDTDEFGYYNGVTWVWIKPGSGNGLDADTLDGQHGSYYRDAGNINAGTLPVVRGGTGISSLTAGNYLNAASTSTLQQRTPAQVRSDLGFVGVQEILTADRTYYVSTTGNDNNDGLTSGTPFLTIQKAIDTVAGLNINSHNVVIQLADGTYTVTSRINLKNVVGFAVAGNLIIRGNASNNTAVHVTNSTAQDTFYANALNVIWRFENFRVSNGVTYLGCFGISGCMVEMNNMDFYTATNGYHIRSIYNGFVDMINSYTISGGARAHVYAAYGGTFRTFGSYTITLNGTPAFSEAFLNFYNGIGFIWGCSYSGSATGSRYKISMNGALRCQPTLPGSLAGTTDTGGQFTSS